ncbi:MAG: hypothetical protein H6871_04365 [Methylobacteriaceae bacterium]|nr:hypothetical protein [Methylobacteriaceae bacterium]MCC0002259.1 hypothetical protein [Methylobacteriaceae bacterium]HPG02150.1 hypothetical protein [Rhodoblastus sp.]
MNDLSLITPPPGLSSADYSMIEQAVMETARGRWFLLEYARRQRAAETQRLTDAVDRLEAIMAGGPAATAEPQVTPQVAPQAERALVAPAEANAALAERLSDIAWRLREDGADPALCTELEREAAGLRPSRADGEVLAPKTTAPPLATPPWETTRETAASDFARDPRAKALARLDSLPIVEKLALFC